MFKVHLLRFPIVHPEGGALMLVVESLVVLRSSERGRVRDVLDRGNR